MRAGSEGRRNSKLELTWQWKQQSESRARAGPAGTPLSLSFDRVRPHGWFFCAHAVESTQWMMLHRPVELAALTGEVTSSQDHISGDATVRKERLLLEYYRRPAHSLRLKSDCHLDAVGDLDEGNAAVHSVVFTVKGHGPFNLAYAFALAVGG
jgi:hypothetical protein